MRGHALSDPEMAQETLAVSVFNCRSTVKANVWWGKGEEQNVNIMYSDLVEII